jgi:3'-phosphoadenosine 5'-phosphosulfate sulfotransferase (PAPS reductase)/FAD synthetase
MTRTIHCFFSGGRDSAVSCLLAKKVADIRHWDFALIHIDTTISMRQTREYVKQYAEWLGAELIILRPKKSFREYAAQYGMWPSLWPPQYRWCYFRLKLEPTVEYLEQNYKQGDIVAFGVKRWDSEYRRGRYKSAFFVREYNSRLKVDAWSPVLHMDDYTVERFISRFGIPRNPIWRILGISGECLCLAGMPLDTIAILLLHFPEEAQELLEIDDLIQKNRKSGKPSAPLRVAQAGFKTLREFYEYIRKQQTLDQYLYTPYKGKTCQGSCLL